MKFLIIGRRQLNNPDDVSEEFEIYQALLRLGEEAVFCEPKFLAVNQKFDWVIIAKSISNLKELLELKNFYPDAKFAYWTPDFMRIADTENGFKTMIHNIDLFIGSMKEEQDWFTAMGVKYLYWPWDVACEIFQPEDDIRVTSYHPQTPHPNEIPIGFIGNWSHNPWRANLLREIQYHFGDNRLHVTGASVKEFTERDDLRNVHYAIYGHRFNQLVGITKINLAMESMGNYDYWGPRMARIMAAGGFAMTWYCEGMYEKFGKDGENVVYFHTVQEAIKKITYYLQHEGERKEIAKRGLIFANKFLRPANRVKELIDYVKNIRV